MDRVSALRKNLSSADSWPEPQGPVRRWPEHFPSPSEAPSPDRRREAAPADEAEAGSVYYLNFKPEQDQQWQDLAAAYTEETTIGEGEKSVTVKFTAEEKTITFTVMTDKEILGDALIDNALIEGEEGAYGLYIKKVNGITADYDVNGAYWAFYIDGEYAATGVDSTEITEGAVYELTYTK